MGYTGGGGGRRAHLGGRRARRGHGEPCQSTARSTRARTRRATLTRRGRAAHMLGPSRTLTMLRVVSGNGATPRPTARGRGAALRARPRRHAAPRMRHEGGRAGAEAPRTRTSRARAAGRARTGAAGGCARQGRASQGRRAARHDREPQVQQARRGHRSLHGLRRGSAPKPGRAAGRRGGCAARGGGRGGRHGRTSAAARGGRREPGRARGRGSLRTDEKGGGAPSRGEHAGGRAPSAGGTLGGRGRMGGEGEGTAPGECAPRASHHGRWARGRGRGRARAKQEEKGAGKGEEGLTAGVGRWASTGEPGRGRGAA
jgi:hypothetical protein